MATAPPEASANFIEQRIDEDNTTGRFDGKVVTRFPPEPNGYLHIGHAKSCCLNFGLAQKYGGRCHMRFDDTNPTREQVEFVDAILDDVRWLGGDWGDHLYYASDCFEQLYAWAVQLVEAGKAYVCDLTPEAMREHRGTLTEPGRPSPSRDRPVAENLDLFQRMRDGEFETGTRTLRARIDMASGNLNLRDPVMYRILKASHHRTGNAWCIYPMYDFTHGQSDSIEGVTHSICTMEFEDHRPLYDWYLEALGVYHPQQIEFARLNLTYTVLSKRRLSELVTEQHVTGWDDPRMPTLRGMRRRGYPPAAIRDFCDRIGVAKRNNVVDIALLEHCVRDVLNRVAPRAMVVLDPLRVVITNYPEGEVEQLEAINNPEDPAMGTRTVPFARELYIERNDFREDPPRKFFRLAPGREVRLRYAYFITCQEVIRDEATGRIEELRCTYDPATRGGDAPDRRKVKATLHWVAAEPSVAIDVLNYDRLFTCEQPEGSSDQRDYLAHLNPDSQQRVAGCRAEPSLADAEPGATVQFERHGYYCVDIASGSGGGPPVFNRTVPLRDSWSKIAASQAKA